MKRYLKYALIGIIGAVIALILLALGSIIWDEMHGLFEPWF